MVYKTLTGKLPSKKLIEQFLIFRSSFTSETFQSIFNHFELIWPILNFPFKLIIKYLSFVINKIKLLDSSE